jgi:hypothetical protein
MRACMHAWMERRTAKREVHYSVLFAVGVPLKRVQAAQIPLLSCLGHLYHLICCFCMGDSCLTLVQVLAIALLSIALPAHCQGTGKIRIGCIGRHWTRRRLGLRGAACFNTHCPFPSAAGSPSGSPSDQQSQYTDFNIVPSLVGILVGMLIICCITVLIFWILFRLHNKAGGVLAIFQEMSDFGASPTFFPLNDAVDCEISGLNICSHLLISNNFSAWPAGHPCCTRELSRKLAFEFAACTRSSLCHPPRHSGHYVSPVRSVMLRH